MQINDSPPHHHGDTESDQGSSIDSGRGPSEDEQSRLNTSLTGKYISFLPDPHQKTYPDLVKCNCGSHNNNHHGYKKDPHHNASHKKGCPQHHSPPYTGKRLEIDSLHDFQNLLQLPPKTYLNKQKANKPGQNHHSKPRGELELPGIVISGNDNGNATKSHDIGPPSPHRHTYGSDNINNQFTQQCYHDITQNKASAHKAMGRQRNSLGRDSTSTWRDDSDGESDGGSTTTSGSFEVGSIDTVVERNPNGIHIPKVHQVYV